MDKKKQFTQQAGHILNEDINPWIPPGQVKETVVPALIVTDVLASISKLGDGFTVAMVSKTTLGEEKNSPPVAVWAVIQKPGEQACTRLSSRHEGEKT